MSDKVKQFLEKQGFKKIVPVGNSWNVDCPFCGDTKNRLGFRRDNEKWNCFNCNKKGKTLKGYLTSLAIEKKGSPKKIEVDTPQKKVGKFKVKKKIEPSLHLRYKAKLKKPGRKTYRYLLRSRGLSAETVDHFHLGSKIMRGHEYISIPFFYNQDLVDIKYRSLFPNKTPSKWKREGCTGNFIFNNSVLFGEKKKVLYICEAEIDAMTLYNAGIKNVISLTNGAKSFPDEFYELISQFKKIYIVLDNDEDGIYGAEKLAKRLGMNKCWNVQLPDDVKDVNDYFWDSEEKKARYSIDEFKELVSKSKQFEVKGLMSVHDALSELNREIRLGVEDTIYGVPSPWPKLNEAMSGGAKPGQLIVLAARPKVGKTTLALNWLNWLDVHEETPTAFISCEMNYMRIAQSLVRINCNTYTTAENIDTLQIAGTYLKMSGRLHIYYPQQGDLELEAMKEKITEIVQKTGCKLLVFDNLLFMARGKDVSEKVGEITQAFKLLAENLGISIVLITHPRKTNHNKALTPDDLKDSSSIFQDLDVLILMHRAQMESEIDEESLNDDSEDIEFDGDIFDPLTEIRVISRYSKGGKTYLNFNGTRGIFKDFGDGFKKSMNKKKEEELKRRKRKESRDARNK